MSSDDKELTWRGVAWALEEAVRHLETLGEDEMLLAKLRAAHRQARAKVEMSARVSSAEWRAKAVGNE